MLIISSQIDLNGERWFYPYKKPAGSKKKFTPEDEALFKLRLLVASSENPQYRSRNALVRRHIDKMDASYRVGTDAFDLASVGEIDSVDDLLIDNAARFLLKGWEGGPIGGWLRGCSRLYPRARDRHAETVPGFVLADTGRGRKHCSG